MQTNHTALFRFTPSLQLVQVTPSQFSDDSLLHVEAEFLCEGSVLQEVVAVIHRPFNQNATASFIAPSRHRKELPFELCSGIGGEPFETTNVHAIKRNLGWDGTPQQLQRLVSELERHFPINHALAPELLRVA